MRFQYCIVLLLFYNGVSDAHGSLMNTFESDLLFKEYGCGLYSHYDCYGYCNYKVKLLPLYLEELNWKQMILIVTSSQHDRFNKLDCIDAMLNHNKIRFEIYYVDVEKENLETIFHFVNNNRRSVSTETKLNFLIYADITEIASILKQINVQDDLEQQQGYFTFFYKWIFLTNIINSGIKLDQLESSLGKVKHVNLIIPNTNDQFRIYTGIWNVFDRKFTLIGLLKNSKVVLNAASSPFPNEKYGFNGQKLIIGTKQSRPFVKALQVNKTTEYSGVFVKVMKMMSIYFNYTYEIVMPADNSWGTLVNGSWTGLVGLLEQRKVDFAVSSLNHIYQRTAAIDFADIPLTIDFATGVYRKPEPTNNTLIVFYKPFKKSVWICIIATTIAFGMLLWFLSDMIIRDHSRKYLQSIQRLSVYMWMVLRSTFAQNMLFKPNMLSVRLIIWSFWMFSLLIFFHWSATVISFMVTTLYPSIFTDLEGLVLQNKYKVGVLGDSVYETILCTSKLTQQQRLWAKIIDLEKYDPEVLYNAESVHIAKLQSEDYVFIQKNTLIKLLMSENCKLRSLDDKITSIQIAIAMQKNSAYKEMINDFTLKLLEFGILDKWFADAAHEVVLAGNSDCVSKLEQVQLSFNHFQYTFVVLLICLFGCLLVFAIECFSIKLLNNQPCLISGS